MSYLHVGSAEPLAGVGGLAALSFGASGLGRVPAPKASPGQYGLALSRIRIPDDAIRLLLLSPRFKRMAQVLDGAYLDHLHWFALQKNNANLTLDSHFRVTGGGGLNGRRVLYMGTDPAGSMFIPGQSIASPSGWDVIRFNDALSDSDVIPWVEAIAHETAHAFARVTTTGQGPTAAAQRVQAAVLEECTARRREQRVLTEIRATTKGRAALANHTLRPVRRCDCERDWFPATQKRSYLEHFVLGAHWEAAARGLSTADVQKILTDVAAIPLKWSTKTQPPTMPIAILRGKAHVGSFAKQFPVLKSAAGQAAFILRLVDASWRQLIAKVGEGSPTWTGGAHQLRLERHARVLFNTPISYTKCP